MKIIAGPCVVESYETTLGIGQILKYSFASNSDLYFKASFKKANRSKLASFSGIDEKEAIDILRKIKNELGIRICTDVHETSDIEKISDFVDVIQIPAFLCRQTDLIVESSKTGAIVNIKKGQFMSPESMKFSVEKARESGCSDVWVTERGTTFGYNDLVVDSTAIPRIKKACECPVILDTTHSLQRPNHMSGITRGSDKSLSYLLMKQAAVSDADGMFFECHTSPESSKSDRETILDTRDIINWATNAISLRRALISIEDPKKF